METTKHDAFSELTLAVHIALSAGLSAQQIQDHVQNILLNAAGEQA